MKGKLRGTLRTFSRRLGQSLRQLPGVEAAKQVARLPIFTYIRHRDRNAHCRYYLSIGAIFKDEARFLDEWIEFHLGIGVEHFYLYMYPVPPDR